ncbi:MAG: DNA-J related domain-containing protein [Woeseiaceae bacterium]
MSDIKTTSIPEVFLLALQAELENHPMGIGEYDLMTNLKSQGYFEFLLQPAQPHELFKAHFFLFHTLYRLQQQLLESKTNHLEIHTLKIQLLAYQQGENTLQADDKLKAYYLDFKNLEDTTEDEVYDLLASFWKKYNKFENRDDALAELELTEPVDNKTIKKQYRLLIMQHHPDRGGNTQKLQKLNDAIKKLLG